MRKTLAIYVAKEVVWEFPLGPSASSQDNDEILKSFKKGDVKWADFTDAEEPDNWHSFRMEIREYGDKKEVE